MEIKTFILKKKFDKINYIGQEETKVIEFDDEILENQTNGTLKEIIDDSDQTNKTKEKSKSLWEILFGNSEYDPINFILLSIILVLLIFIGAIFCCKSLRDFLFGSEYKGYMQIIPQINPDNVIDVDLEHKVKEEQSLKQSQEENEIF